MAAHVIELEGLRVALTAELHQSRRDLAEERENTRLLPEELDGSGTALRRMIRGQTARAKDSATLFRSVRGRGSRTR